MTNTLQVQKTQTVQRPSSIADVGALIKGDLIELATHTSAPSIHPVSANERGEIYFLEKLADGGIQEGSFDIDEIGRIEEGKIIVPASCVNYLSTRYPETNPNYEQLNGLFPEN